MLSGVASKIIKGLWPQVSRPAPPPPGRDCPFHIRAGQFPPYGTYTYRMTLEPYTPEMLDVKVVDGEIVVKGKIEEQVGEDRWSYEFVKRHRIPSEVDLNTVETRFELGQLVVTAKLKQGLL